MQCGKLELSGKQPKIYQTSIRLRNYQQEIPMRFAQSLRLNTASPACRMMMRLLYLRLSLRPVP